MRTRRLLHVACGGLMLSALMAGSVWAQASPPARVLVLGTYHFANPGLDVVQTEVADVLEPVRQAEIEAILQTLALFQPTRIAVEWPATRAAWVDSVYAAYLAGERELSRNEAEQLGLRLAARLDHARVYPIDHPGQFPFEAAMAYAAEHEPEFLANVMEDIALITAEMNRRQREHTVGQILRLMNQPGTLAEDHDRYLRFARIGAGDGYAGADLLSRWYERNIRIFANLQAITEPGDRLLVIIGAGHAPILRELITYDQGMELVEAVDYLPES